MIGLGISYKSWLKEKTQRWYSETSGATQQEKDWAALQRKWKNPSAHGLIVVRRKAGEKSVTVEAPALHLKKIMVQVSDRVSTDSRVAAMMLRETDDTMHSGSSARRRRHRRPKKR